MAYGFGGVALSALFETDVVLDADSGARGHLLAPQSGHPANSPGADTHHVRGESFTVATQELCEWADIGC